MLRYAIDFIKTIKDENLQLKEQLGIASPEASLEGNTNNSSCFESFSSSSEDSDNPGHLKGDV